MVMPMLMMNVGVMRVTVRDGLVPMRVCVRLCAIPREVVLVLVVRIVHVGMAVQ